MGKLEVMNDSLLRDMFSRNVGLISETEQKLLFDSTVAIAGTGADGGLVAERLARVGVGHLRLADPDSFDVSNFNRQFASNQTTVGRNKAEVVGEEIQKINPQAEVKTYLGVNASNVAEFIRGASVVIDEIDYTRLDISVMFHREARAQNKYIFLAVNIGWGANVFVFAPDGMTLEDYVGLPAEATTEEMKNFPIPPEKFAPDVPDYMDAKVIEGIVNGSIPIPSVSPSVALEAGILSTLVTLFLTKNVVRGIVPSFVGVDLFSRKSFL